MIKNSKIIDITPRISKEAGLLHADMKVKMSSFPLTDAIIISCAIDNKTKILTTDNHFKGFKEAILLD